MSDSPNPRGFRAGDAFIDMEYVHFTGKQHDEFLQALEIYRSGR